MSGFKLMQAPIASDDCDFEFLSLGSANLPPLRMLTTKQVAKLAIRAAGCFREVDLKDIVRINGRFVLKTKLYELEVIGDSERAVIAKSQCAKFWRRILEVNANAARLNHEAANRLVGGRQKESPKYASDETVRRVREKAEIFLNYASNRVVINNGTGEEFSFLDLVKSSERNKFAELYWVVKNFQTLAIRNNMCWLFVTFTAPPELHPNPKNGRCSYNSDLGLKASHIFILNSWGNIRAALNKDGLRAGPLGYYGLRIAEVHLDGAVHWHLLVFIAGDNIEMFESACRIYFPLQNQLKIEVGDDSRGSAGSYVFKYLAKGFSQSIALSEEEAASADLNREDDSREDADFSTIRNGERVRAALKAMKIRQYQNYGVRGVMTLLKHINRLSEEVFDTLSSSLAVLVKENIWRNEFGLIYLLENSQLIDVDGEGYAPLMLHKKDSTTVYGEKSSKVLGVKIDGEILLTTGRFTMCKLSKSKKN